MAEYLAMTRIAPPKLASLRLFRPEPSAVEAAGAALGFALAADAGRWSIGEIRSLRIAPNEWLVRGGLSPGEIAGKLGATLHHAEDLTAGCAAWEIAGAGAAGLLAMGGTLDFERWEAGAGARTRFAQIPVIVSNLRPTPAFEIVCETSFAAYLMSWLCAASAAGKRMN